MKFSIQQLALYPRDSIAARKLLTDMGADRWENREFCGVGHVFGDACESEWKSTTGQAIFAKAPEIEIASYIGGPSSADLRPGEPHRAAYLGMECTADELESWRSFFADRRIHPAQDIKTGSGHHEVIFDTFDILAIDVKLTVRSTVK